jgi:hypothetical protein
VLLGLPRPQFLRFGPGRPCGWSGVFSASSSCYPWLVSSGGGSIEGRAQETRRISVRRQEGLRAGKGAHRPGLDQRGRGPGARSLGLIEDALLILSADHGEYMGEHGWWGHHPPGLMPGIHVPLMMIYPKRFQESERIEDPVQMIEVIILWLAMHLRYSHFEYMINTTALIGRLFRLYYGGVKIESSNRRPYSSGRLPHATPSRCF